MKNIVLWLQVMALMLSASAATAFTLLGDPREIAADVSIIPYWDTVVIEKGDTISKGCAPFLEAVPTVTPLNCWRLVAAVNNLSSFTIREGERLLLPSSANTEAEVKARLDAFTENAETSAYGDMSLAALSRDPLGMASEIRRALVGLDRVTKEIAVLETEVMTAAEIKAMVATVLSNVEVSDKAVLTSNVQNAVKAAEARGSLTAYQVSALITTQLALAGLSETTQQRALIAAQSGRLDTIEATQKAQATTLTGHGSAIEGLAAADATLSQRVETLEAGLVWSKPALAALLVAAVALVIAILLARRQRRASTQMVIANKLYAERLAVVETGMTSRKAINLPADLEATLMEVNIGSTHQVEMSVDAELFVVTFTRAPANDSGGAMVTMTGVKDQTQSVHVERVRSVLLRAARSGRLMTPKPPVAQLVA